jgi:hypothetical protein
MRPAKQKRAPFFATHVRAPVLTTARGGDKSAKCGFLGVFLLPRGDLRDADRSQGQTLDGGQEPERMRVCMLAFAGLAQ